MSTFVWCLLAWIALSFAFTVGFVAGVSVKGRDDG